MSIQTALDEYDKFKKELNFIQDRIAKFCSIISTIVIGNYLDSIAPSGYRDCITLEGYSLVLSKDCVFVKKESITKSIADFHNLPADDYIKIFKLLPKFWEEVNKLFMENMDNKISKTTNKIEEFSFINSFD